MTQQKFFRHAQFLFLLFLSSCMMWTVNGIVSADSSPSGQAKTTDSNLNSNFNKLTGDGILGLDTDIFAIQDDGRIVTAKYALVSGNHRLIIQRFTSTGDPDPSFGSGGAATLSIDNVEFQPIAIDFQSTGTIIIGGNVDLAGAGLDDFKVIRLTPHGAIDGSFQSSVVTLSHHVNHQGLSDIAVQDDNKIIAFGTAPDCGTFLCDSEFLVARFQPNGGYDTTFASSGSRTIDFGKNDVAANVEIRSDGKIVLFGVEDDHATTVDEKIGVARLHNDGSYDTSFDGDGKVLAERKSGLKLARGTTLQNGTTVSIHRDGKLLSHTASGERNGSFGSNGERIITTALGDLRPKAIASHADNTLIVAGTIDALTSPISLVKLLPNGTIDPAFGTQGIATAYAPTRDVHGLQIMADGRILLLGGDLDQGNLYLFRLMSNGLPDNGGWATLDATSGNDIMRDMALMPDGHIAIVGTSGQGHSVARFASNGTIDPTFTQWGYFSVGSNRAFGRAITTDAQNRVWVVSGHEESAANLNFIVRRYEQNGDSAFFPETPAWYPITDWGGVNDVPVAIVVLSDGRFYVGGSSDGRIAITRYLANGLPDTSFGSNGTVIKDYTSQPYDISTMVVQPDGKLIIAGNLGSTHVLVRYLPNGLQDTTFGFGSGELVINYPQLDNEQLEEILLLPDGTFVTVGTASKNNGNHMLVTWHHANGTRNVALGDFSQSLIEFDVQTNGRAVTRDVDGSLMVAGCHADPSIGMFAVARLTPAGVVDTRFGDNGTLLLATPSVGNACANELAYDAASDTFLLGGHVTGIDSKPLLALASIYRGFDVSAPTAVTLTNDGVSAELPLLLPLLLTALLLLTSTQLLRRRQV